MANKQRVHADPRITYSALAKLLGSNSTLGWEQIVHDSKFPPKMKVISYADCSRALTDILVDGTSAAHLESHEEEVVKLFKASKPKLPKDVKSSKPPQANQTKKWPIEGVDVSFVSDVSLTGPAGVGAMKFHCNKEPLARGVGPKMASLLFLYLRDHLKLAGVVPEYCLIYEPRTGKMHRPGKVPEKTFDHAKSACRLVANFWPIVSAT